MDVPQRELLRTKYDETAPIRTPTHVGCAFSIDREFFFEIGTFDEQMQIWGSENVELSFRVCYSVIIDAEVCWFQVVISKKIENSKGKSIFESTV